MSKRFVAGMYNGKSQAFLQKSNNDAALDNLYANLADFSFHSDLEHFIEVGVAAGSKTLGSTSPTYVTVESGKSASSHVIPVEKVTLHLVPGLSWGSKDFAFGYDTATDALLCGAAMVQKSGDSYRSVSLQRSGSAVYLRERTITGTTSLPAMTFSYRVHVFRADPQYKTHPGVLVEMQPGQVVLAEGRFNSDRGYLYKDPPSANPKMAIPTKHTTRVEVRPRGGSGADMLCYGYNFNGKSFWYGQAVLPADQTPVKMGVL